MASPGSVTRSYQPMRQRGFTLIELLVVVSIIAVLAALLLPGVAIVQRSAYKVRCLSSLRQVVIATIGYSDDADGCLPPALDAGNLYWIGLIGPYLGTDGAVERASPSTTALNASFWSVLKGCTVRNRDAAFVANASVSGWQAAINPGYTYRFFPHGAWGTRPNNWSSSDPLNPHWGRIPLATLKQPDRRGAYCDAEKLDAGSGCSANGHERHQDASGFAFFSGRTAMLKGSAAASNAWSTTTPAP
jgi:prepilin-type N-terminal cleavage/methylation domain-containing protein